MEALNLHRLQFAFTITYHYLFPQVTMGLALLIFILKTKAVYGNEAANQAVGFWTIDVIEQKRLNEAREAVIPWKKWGPI
jgi:cytochrome bd-type quinol oxidase subunit 1